MHGMPVNVNIGNTIFFDNMKRSILFLFVLLMVSTQIRVHAEYKWYGPWDAGYQVVNGLAFPRECIGQYQRIGNMHKSEIPDYVWWNSLHSAGLSLRFVTHSPEIMVRYTCSSHRYAMPHMPSTGVSGIDLYAHDSKGNELLCHGSYSFGDTVKYTYGPIAYHDSQREEYEYELFFPMYNSVTWMEIGVPEEYAFRFVEADKRKPIVVYGTSIAHGGCASRPAMAWTNIVKRDLDLPLINWGFSGSGRLDASMFELMGKVDACLYVIDCMPNMTRFTSEEIVDRLVKGIHILRAKSNAPILVVEHDGYNDDQTNENSWKDIIRRNVACKQGYDQLKKEGVKGLYYLSKSDINMDPEGMVDGIHSTDLGMMCYAKAYVPKIRKILGMKKKRQIGHNHRLPQLKEK